MSRHSLRTTSGPRWRVLTGLILVTGLAYPAAVTAVAQVVFPSQANGSMIVADGRTVGSALIGQAFSEPRYFWGRPSAAGRRLRRHGVGRLEPRTDQPRADRPGRGRGRPPARGERRRAGAGRPGDQRPHRGSTRTSAPRPPRTRWRAWPRRGALTRSAVEAAVARHTDGPLLGFLGQPRVHVLELNLDLDGLLR